MPPIFNPEHHRCKNIGRWWGFPPPGNFEKICYLRQHFVHFEDSLLGNEAGKSEGH